MINQNLRSITAKNIDKVNIKRDFSLWFQGVGQRIVFQLYFSG